MNSKMCSCFENPHPSEQTSSSGGSYLSLFSNPNKKTVYPDQTCHAVISSGQTRAFRFGLRVDWTAKPIFNARLETFMQKPTFVQLQDRRCLVPCLAYFEWRTDARAVKHKNKIRAKDPTLLWMAGFYQDERCVILTRPADQKLAHIHSRMPVFISDDHLDTWWQAPIRPEGDVFTTEADLTAIEEKKVKAQMDLF